MTLVGRCTECGKRFRVPHDRKAWTCKACGGAVLVEEAQSDGEEAGVADPSPAAAEREGAPERRRPRRTQRSRGPKRRASRAESEWEEEEEDQPSVTPKALRKSLVRTLFATVLMTAAVVVGLPTLKALDMGDAAYRLTVFGLAAYAVLLYSLYGWCFWKLGSGCVRAAWVLALATCLPFFGAMIWNDEFVSRKIALLFLAHGHTVYRAHAHSKKLRAREEARTLGRRQARGTDGFGHPWMSGLELKLWLAATVLAFAGVAFLAFDQRPEPPPPPSPEPIALELKAAWDAEDLAGLQALFVEERHGLVERTLNILRGEIGDDAVWPQSRFINNLFSDEDREGSVAFIVDGRPLIFELKLDEQGAWRAWRVFLMPRPTLSGDD